MRSAGFRTILISGGLLVLAASWALWPILLGMADRWETDPRYSHGFLVPLFSLGLLWTRRSRLSGLALSPSNWGLVVLAIGAGVQLFGGYFMMEPIAALALIPYLAGTALLLGGFPLLKWSLIPIAFLAFMIPPPWRLESFMDSALQSLATQVSTFVLQCLGMMAAAQGNVIQLSETRLGVAEACSGLSMLITLIALATAVAIVIDRPLADRVVLVLSSIPVALIANVARIVLTAVLQETVGGEETVAFHHDLAGWVMIPFALLLYWGEIQILSKLAPEEDQAAEVVDSATIAPPRPPVVPRTSDA